LEYIPSLSLFLYLYIQVIKVIKWLFWYQYQLSGHESKRYIVGWGSNRNPRIYAKADTQNPPSSYIIITHFIREVTSRNIGLGKLLPREKDGLAVETYKGACMEARVDTAYSSLLVSTSFPLSCYFLYNYSPPVCIIIYELQEPDAARTDQLQVATLVLACAPDISGYVCV
jgi:hypothetical protein